MINQMSGEPLEPLKQFVPSDVCLKCDGCCRFKAADSPWRPKLGAGDRQSLGAQITAGDILDDTGHIKTIQACGRHVCRFLNPSDSTCRVYANRPFECALYPFILSRTAQGIKVYAHLSCPYVQLQEAKPAFHDYAAYLKEYFSRAGVRDFLRRNSAMFHDYTPFVPELLHLFDLELPSP